jgi:hypothetical protein
MSDVEVFVRETQIRVRGRKGRGEAESLNKIMCVTSTRRQLAACKNRKKRGYLTSASEQGRARAGGRGASERAIERASEREREIEREKKGERRREGESSSPPTLSRSS